MARRKQLTFKGYRIKGGEVFECKEGEAARLELQTKLAYKGKMTPQYYKAKRR